MKLATLTVASLISFQVLAQNNNSSSVKITELESVGGELSIGLEIKSSGVKKGILFKKMLAKREAINNAKTASLESLSNICRSSSFSAEDVIYSEPNCNNAESSIDCSMTAQVRCSEISERNTIGLQIDNKFIQPSTACLKVLEGDFQINNDLVNNCNRIKTKTQYECVSTLTTYSSVKSLAIRACSVFSSNLSQEVLEEYKNRGFESPNPSFIVVLAAANTDQEATCIKNKLSLSSLSVQDLEKSCINDSKLDLDKREYEALGFVLNPRTLQYKFKEVIGH